MTTLNIEQGKFLKDFIQENQYKGKEKTKWTTPMVVNVDTLEYLAIGLMKRQNVAQDISESEDKIFLDFIKQAGVSIDQIGEGKEYELNLHTDGNVTTYKLLKIKEVASMSIETTKRIEITPDSVRMTYNKSIL